MSNFEYENYYTLLKESFIEIEKFFINKMEVFMNDLYITSLLSLIKSMRESAEITKKNCSKDLCRSALAYADGYEHALKWVLESVYHLSPEEIEKELNN